MVHGYLIATSKAPRQNKATEFVQAITDAAAKCGLDCVAIYGTTGPGCYNLALKLNGDKKTAEQLVKELTMALMPARYCDNNEAFEGFKLENLKE